MDADWIFRWVVLTQLLAQRLVRLPRRREISLKGNLKGIRERPLDGFLLLGTKISVIATLVVYVFVPSWIDQWSISLPVAVRIAFAVFSVGGIVLISWDERAMAKNLSVSLQIRKEQVLVRNGPYALIRHPIYVASWTFLVGISLQTSNWLVIAICAGLLTVLFVYRIPKEEEMLLEHFGEPYRNYMKVTGRFLPRIGALIGKDNS